MRGPDRPPGFFLNEVLTGRLGAHQIKALVTSSRQPAHETVTAPDLLCSGQPRAISGGPTTRTGRLKGAANRG
jgi:hypothetical protein